VEIAPAPNLDAELRDRILADATKLARAANYVNAGTAASTSSSSAIRGFRSSTR
jgi:pyruvate carboxylase